MKLRLIFCCVIATATAAMTGCGATAGGYNMPPASRLMEPGPGVGGPGPGVINMPTPGIEPASYAAPIVGGGGGAMGGGGGVGAMMAASEVQVLFARPEAMQVSFDSGGSYGSSPIITPGRQNFMQGGVYRLKITGVPGREGTELYPSLEIGPPTRQTAAYLAHNAIPIQVTEEDFDQILAGNFVTKVIYLPEPDFQELALAGVETLVSTRLDPGVDPIVEANRRGAILAVLRIGNKDMEIPGGSSVMPTYGAAGMPSGVIPASYAAAARGRAPMQPGRMAPITRAAGSGVRSAAAIPTTAVGPGGVTPASACGDCGVAGCGGGAGCLSGLGGGGCLGGGCLTPAGGPEAFYGPNSTPRGGHGPGGLPPGLMGAGQYGMPITGTPIGLPGPPHIPLGVPAGLKKHVMHNWTSRHIPDPVSKLKINVKQRPGISYPQPPNRAWVTEDTIHSAPHFSNRHFGAPGSGLLGGGIQGGGMGGACGPGDPCQTGGAGGLMGGLRGLLHH